MKKLIWIPFLLLQVHCTHSPKPVPPVSVSPPKTNLSEDSSPQKFSLIIQALNSKKPKKALSLLKKIDPNLLEEPWQSEWFILQGKSLVALNKTVDGLVSLGHALVLAKTDDRKTEILWLRVEWAQSLHWVERALVDLNEIEKLEPDTATLLAIHRARLRLTNPLDTENLLKSLAYLIEFSPLAEEVKEARFKGNEMISFRVSLDRLQNLATLEALGPFLGAIHFRLGELLLENNLPNEALTAFQAAAGHTKDVVLAEKAEIAAKRILSRQNADPRTVAALLPLSGERADAAQLTLRGLTLGLGLADQPPSPIRLVLIDSKANPDVAVRELEKINEKEAPIALIGSLLSKTAKPVAEKATQLGIPSVALSRKENLTDLDPSVMRISVPLSAQMARLAQVATEQLGLTRFAILYPNDSYGVEATNRFWDEVRALGGEIVGAQTYDPGTRDFDDQVKRLVGTFYVEDRLEEFRQLQEEWKEKNPKLSLRHQPPNDLLPPRYTFQAIFVPADVEAMGQIAATLATHLVKNVRLLGPDLWNNPDLVRRGRQYVEGAVFVDVPPVPQNTSFWQAYQTNFGVQPGFLELQGFEAGFLLRRILLGNVRSRQELIEKFNQLGSYPGSVGEMNKFSPREIVFPLEPLIVHNGQIIPLKNNEHPPSPNSFKER